MSPHCLDSDFLIEVLEGNAKALDALRDFEAAGRPFVSAVTAFEVTHVPSRLRRQIAMDALSALEIVPIDGSVAIAGSRLSIELQREGRGVPMPDLLIAGTCVLRGLTLVTRNAKHFGRIRGLKTISW